jgi:Cu(I)/Ag(I) efflux system membrane fusion protein
LDNEQMRLKPEMYGELRMAMPAGPAGPVIPRSALFEDAGEHCVFVAVNDTTFLRRAVRPGPATADSLLVGAGLRAGERVVSAGVFLLKSELRKDAMGGE